jgi:protein-L-isoaspartate(D-aspartate) O-methyltransferase
MVRGIADRMAATAGETGVEKLDPKVQAALECVPRHRFVPDEAQHLAYADAALSIGCGQTISQPFIVALMTQLAAVSPSSIVLEIGAGSGYQAAVLAQLARRVYSIEIVPELARRAASTVAELGYTNVEIRCGDGYEGWEEHAPFDVILVTAATTEPPPSLIRQLALGGRMLLPLGDPSRQPQDLVLLQKGADGKIAALYNLPVAFVPLTRA